MQGFKHIPFVIRIVRRIAEIQSQASDLRPPTSDRRSSRAFTLIEMMVVIGMLAILMGVAFSGIGQARAQARVAKANVEVRELVNAWLSYEAAKDDWPAEVPKDGMLEANEANLKVLLGKGEDATVYLNAQMVGQKREFLDPWGHPYVFRIIDRSGTEDSKVQETFPASVTFPNRHRYVR